MSASLAQQCAGVLALGDSGGTVARGGLRPFGNALQPYPVLDFHRMRFVTFNGLE